MGNNMRLETDINQGLSSQEVIEFQLAEGKNELITKKRKSKVKMLIEQLKEPMVMVILIAAIISTIAREYTDAIVILFVVVVNAIIGVIQEDKAEKSLDALKKLTSPKAVVKRDGISMEVDASDLVVGDVVILEAGRYVPADLILKQTINLQVEESALTGESVPVNKDSDFNSSATESVGDMKNMAFMSTYVTYGRGMGIVRAVGMQTEIGKIAKMIDDAPEQLTPLQQSLKSLGITLGIICGVICLLMFGIGFLQGRELFEMFLLAISLAVAAIPEGLPAIVTIVLAIGVQKMSKNHAIIRKLPAVETLGTVNVICSDKTGTLTQNKMTVVEYATGTNLKNKLDRLSGDDALLIEGFVLCSDAHYESDKAFGDPTEIALIDMGLAYDFEKNQLDKHFQRVNEIPFDSSRKLMTTVHEMGEKIISFTKGAADNLIEKCDYILQDGKQVPFTEDKKALVYANMSKMSQKALRVLALGYRELTSKDEQNLEQHLVFIGLVGMIDPPRLEVKPAIKLTKKSHIKTVMITGDHKDTAFAIAKELGIANNESEVMIGSELDKLSQEELEQIINNYRVFARVSPEHKVSIVKAFQSHGDIVSMTGDGVNDAPSLKNANIGVAMGITGTDVTKGASDMILTDDNFATIVKAVEEGRVIYQNIKKAVLFLLSCNLGEIMALLTAIVFSLATPLLPIHILWVNLVTDSFPALALGVDPNSEDLMAKRPRKSNESLFSNGGWFFVIFNGLWIGSVTLIGFIVALNHYNDSLLHAQTIAFMILAISQLFHSLNLRSMDQSLFKVGFFKNKLLILSILLGILIQIIITSVGFFQMMFKITPLTLMDWAMIILASFSVIVVNEILKYFKRKRG